MCCRSEWQERMYIYKWHEVDQTKHEIFCVHIVCNEIQVKVNLEITTFFFYLRFPYCPNFFWFGVVLNNYFLFHKVICFSFTSIISYLCIYWVFYSAAATTKKSYQCSLTHEQITLISVCVCVCVCIYIYIYIYIYHYFQSCLSVFLLNESKCIWSITPQPTAV